MDCSILVIVYIQPESLWCTDMKELELSQTKGNLLPKLVPGVVLGAFILNKEYLE